MALRRLESQARALEAAVTAKALSVRVYRAACAGRVGYATWTVAVLSSYTDYEARGPLAITTKGRGYGFSLRLHRPALLKLTGGGGRQGAPRSRWPVGSSGSLIREAWRKASLAASACMRWPLHPGRCWTLAVTRPTDSATTWLLQPGRAPATPWRLPPQSISIPLFYNNVASCEWGQSSV